ncbi:MAG: hypothetical protein QXF56_02790 [Candidatus Micrarchaeia archaeon]
MDERRKCLNISYVISMWIWEWRGKPLFISAHAMDELKKLNWRMERALEILEDGHTAQQRMRKTRERWPDA